MDEPIALGDTVRTRDGREGVVVEMIEGGAVYLRVAGLAEGVLVGPVVGVTRIGGGGA